MIGKTKLFKILEPVLAASEADQTEVVFVGNDSALTRYANSVIHQNVHETNNSIYFRSLVGKRVGVASCNSLAPEDIRQTLADSLEIARQRPEDPDLTPVPKPAKYKKITTFDKATASFSANDRARLVKKIIALADKQHFTVAGSLATASGEIAVLNSVGVRAYQPVTSASVSVIAMSDTSSGYASGASRRIKDLDIPALAERAVETCRLSQNPISIEPGDYEVILEPPAVAEMLEWLDFVSFASKPFEQNMSFLSGKIGQKITSSQISVYDDGLDTKANAFPFDFEGVPKKRLFFLQHGVAKGVAHDTMSARKAGTKSTGHAMTPDQRDRGAMALNIFMAPGKANRAKMLAGVKKGILVTRFHYLNGYIDPRNSVLTGMTRDGTFLVEDGKIKCGIKNLRFTDSFTRAFESVKAISKQVERIDTGWGAVGCITVPAVHLGSFRFSGKTDF
jgi:PmbA protein